MNENAIQGTPLLCYSGRRLCSGGLHRHVTRSIGKGAVPAEQWFLPRTLDKARCAIIVFSPLNCSSTILYSGVACCCRNVARSITLCRTSPRQCRHVGMSRIRTPQTYNYGTVQYNTAVQHLAVYCRRVYSSKDIPQLNKRNVGSGGDQRLSIFVLLENTCYSCSPTKASTILITC